jgi:glycosyltransferase involved in cell wall biosynthesis
MKELLKRFSFRAGIDIKRIPDWQMWKTVSLNPLKPSKGNVLLSYRTSPFLKGGEEEMRIHTAAWECVQIAQTFLDRGYCVDVIYWLNNQFVPQKEYAFFIDVHSNLERIGPMLNKECVKILHIVWAHWLFHNHAAYKRHLALMERRGLALKPVRQLEPARGIEWADYATMLGNEFTAGTYGYAKKPIFPLPISTQSVYPPPTDKDLESCRRHYLWLGGTGLVHKGLDLVLEVFAEMPEYHLTVCGSISHEKDFVKAYYRELYETPNIHTIGWLDVGSAEFLKIANSCIGLIHPSCSEGQSGSVVNCLHAGLVPVVSYESGLDVEEFGVVLTDCSIGEIKTAIEHVSSLSGANLRERSERAWEYARARHTREQFAKEYDAAVEKIMALSREH